MNPQDPLSQLRDIHMPQSGGFWPPAPGWWILAIILILLFALAVWLVRRWRRRNLWIRLAKAELANLERHQQPTTQWFAQLNTLLKRAAREGYPNLHPEALSGDDWIEFLLTNAPNDRGASRPIVEAIVHSTWQPVTTADPGQALAFAHRWLGAQTC